MATLKQLNPTTHTLFASVVTGSRSLTRLTPKQATQLALAGLTTIDGDGKFKISNKGQRTWKRHVKAERQAQCTDQVRDAAREILAQDASDAEDGRTVRCTQHRALWNHVGRCTFSRDEVLNALKALRTEGVLDSRRSSNNNFQVNWFLVEDVVKAQTAASPFVSLDKLDKS